MAPAALPLLDRRPHCLTHEGAALSGSRDLVNLSHQCVIEIYVHSHVLSVAHRRSADL